MEDSWLPDYVSLGPGGTKGFYLLGVIFHLKRIGYLNQVKGYIGCSVGSMISLLLCVGYDPINIITIAADTKIFEDFFSLTLADRMTEIRNNIGLVSNASVQARLEEAVGNKVGFLPNLLELYNRTGIDFWTVSYNMTSRKPTYISWRTHPDMPVVTAVMLSINIPFVFYQLEYKNETHIDGGFVDPVPIAPIDDGINRILSITTVTDTEHTNCLTSYVHGIIMSSIDQLANMIISVSSEQCRFLRIKSRTMDTTGVTLDVNDKAQMVQDGIKAGEYYIDYDHVLYEPTDTEGLSPILSLLSGNQSRIVFYPPNTS